MAATKKFSSVLCLMPITNEPLEPGMGNLVWRCQDVEFMTFQKLLVYHCVTLQPFWETFLKGYEIKIKILAYDKLNHFS